MAPICTQALNAVLASIAKEEAALGNLIYAETDGINRVLCTVRNKCCNPNLQLLQEVNQSAKALIQELTGLEYVLKEKLRLTLSGFPACDQPARQTNPCGRRRCCGRY